MTKAKKTSRSVVVATKSRPWLVMCGTLAEQTAETVTLTDARCVVYFAPETRSVIGLATHGPRGRSRVTMPATRIAISGYEVVIDATPEAVAAWQAEPWT